ncbi:LPS-assembly protein LptD [Histidinibacterium lentulum]|uniref:LPS-assembly protein LptD n=1 Tax=Histidinibacterium lentulum TaxID=2480588 RepID=A0A3N2QTU2_9RHOB|nr:LPS assembly protein LptD [Histidinibacterium lentulum]ROT98455.1 LPS-assembly protein LptD [Histidinibacterium lentulum]
MRRLALALLFCLAATAGAAQGVAQLVADSVTVEEDGRLVARGNVEAFYEGTRLSATEIAYDEDADRLTILGPILIRTEDGTIFTAERAELDPQFENGLLRGARLVLEDRLQLAAARIDRRDGTVTQLTRTAATSCRVCGDRPPLWEIRATRVIRDETAERLYFENATLRIGGLPVAYIPRMRLPEPGVTRATGLLVPSIRRTDRLGTGVRIPYFITFGPSRDLTLTPYLSPNTATLEFAYRQAFLRGDLRIEGALTDDTISPQSERGYLFADADFVFEGGWQLEAEIRATSDKAYLVDYGFSGADRLDSFAELRRIEADERLSFGVSVVESLREGDVNAEQPSILPRARYERILRLPRLPGRFTFGASADAAIRESPADARGRDTGRLGVNADLTLTPVLPGGLLATVSAGIVADAYRIEDDRRFDTSATQGTPYLAADLRWPLVRSGANGVIQVLEPVVALSWSETYGPAVPNEDSQVVELDEVNLFGLSRFPGEDAREDGLRGAVGLTWGIEVPDRLSGRLTFGRLYRAERDPRLSPGTGLDGLQSDILLRAGLELETGLAFDIRMLVDPDFEFSRSEARLSWENARTALAATYTELSKAPGENRDAAVAEWAVDAAYRATPSWTILGEARYDLVAEEPIEGTFGLRYQNECITVGLSVSRRFTSSTTLEPETDYGISVSLDGFAADDGFAPAPRACR